MGSLLSPCSQGEPCSQELQQTYAVQYRALKCQGLHQTYNKKGTIPGPLRTRCPPEYAVHRVLTALHCTVMYCIVLYCTLKAVYPGLTLVTRSRLKPFSSTRNFWRPWHHHGSAAATAARRLGRLLREATAGIAGCEQRLGGPRVNLFSLRQHQGGSIRVVGPGCTSSSGAVHLSSGTFSGSVTTGVLNRPRASS